MTTFNTATGQVTATVTDDYAVPRDMLSIEERGLLHHLLSSLVRKLNAKKLKRIKRGLDTVNIEKQMRRAQATLDKIDTLTPGFVPRF